MEANGTLEQQPIIWEQFILDWEAELTMQALIWGN